MANSKSIFVGFMVGGAVSVAATLISTPSSGKDFRNRAKEQSVEWKEMLDNLKLDGLRLKKQITDTSREGAALIKELTQEMKNSVEDWKETVEPHQESIHKYLEQIESSLKDLENKMKTES